jgi:hypothetical protein
LYRAKSSKEPVSALGGVASADVLFDCIIRSEFRFPATKIGVRPILTFSSCRLVSRDAQREIELSCRRIEGLLCSGRVQSIQAALAGLTTERADAFSLRNRTGMKMIVRAVVALLAVRLHRSLLN